MQGLETPFPEAFKQELKEYIGLMNPKEDNRPYIDKKFQDAGIEDKIAPNTLLQMQEIANAPWDVAGSGEGMTREDYIAFIKNQEMEEERNQAEPPKLQAPMYSEIGI